MIAVSLGSNTNLVSMATFLNGKKSSNGEPSRGTNSSKAKSKFLPSIFEEKHEDKIQDFLQALQIDDVERDQMEGSVRSGFNGSNAYSETQGPRSRAGIAKMGNLGRRSSDSSFEICSSHQSKRQNAAFAWGIRSKSGIMGGKGSFGYGQQKSPSPGVSRSLEDYTPEVIDLTDPEQVKNIAARFFEELSDPRFNNSEDITASWSWKTERKFSCDELRDRGRNSSDLTTSTWVSNREILRPFRSTSGKSQAPMDKSNFRGFHENSRPLPQLKSKYFEVYYTEPKTTRKIKIEKKNLATSFESQSNCVSKKRRERILSPIRREVERSNTI